MFLVLMSNIVIEPTKCDCGEWPLPDGSKPASPHPYCTRHRCIKPLLEHQPYGGPHVSNLETAQHIPDAMTAQRTFESAPRGLGATQQPTENTQPLWSSIVSQSPRVPQPHVPLEPKFHQERQSRATKRRQRFSKLSLSQSHHGLKVRNTFNLSLFFVEKVLGSGCFIKLPEGSC